MSVELTHQVKAMAKDAGFAAMGVAPAGAVPGANTYLEWVRQGCHAEMAYMTRNVPLRLEPARLMPGARSVICLAYAIPSGAAKEAAVARYAQGRDYHKVLKQKCIALMDALRRIAPDFDGRAFVDSGPVMERSLAAAAGLGWIGRNGCLIVPGLGSHVLLCEIICNLPLVADQAIQGSCGECGRCVQACPTQAILPGGMVDARRCVSYLTIEHQGQIDPQLWPEMGLRLFGCDACQEACPHNAQCGTQVPMVEVAAALAAVLSWTESDWDAATRGRALRRASLEMFLRNAVIAAGNSGRSELLQPLRKLLARAQGELEFLRPIIEWALKRI